MAIDNHLLGLREVAQELELEKPELFKDDAYHISNQFILSTSQVRPSTASLRHRQRVFKAKLLAWQIIPTGLKLEGQTKVK